MADSGNTQLPKTEVIFNGKRAPTGPRKTRGDNAASILPSIEQNPRSAGLNRNSLSAATPGPRGNGRKLYSGPSAPMARSSFARSSAAPLEWIEEEPSHSEESHSKSELDFGLERPRVKVPPRKAPGESPALVTPPKPKRNHNKKNVGRVNYSGAKYGDMGAQPDRSHEGAPPPPDRSRQ